MAYTCIAPHCAKDCSGCVSAIAPDDEPRQIILALLTEFAGATSLEDGEHTVIDRARAYLRIPAAALSAPTEQVPAIPNPSITFGRDGVLLYWRSHAGYFSITLDDEGEYAWGGVLGDDPANSSAGFALTKEVIDTFRDVLAASPSAPTAVQPCPDAARMAEHACSDAAQCWEPCGQLGKSEEHARAVSAEEEPEVYSALAALTAVQPAYPEGDVVAACVCGSWPGGKCLKCKWVPATPTAVKEAGGVDADVIDEAAGFVRVAFGHGAADWNSGVDALAYELKRLLASAAQPATPVEPIDMVLHCPACGLQHIDAEEVYECQHPTCGCDSTDGPPCQAEHNSWHNPPHRSHLCRGCSHVWRPADVPTNGIAAVKTKGKADSPIATPVAPKTLEALTDGEVDDLSREMVRGGKSVNWLAREFGRRLAAKNNMTLGGE